MIYYDQKGKASYLHTVQYDENKNLENFKNWESYFVTRAELIENLKQLDIYKTDNIIDDKFLYEEKIIESIYKVAEFKDENKNSKLSISKTKASDWRSFKQTTYNTINDSTVVITQNNDYNWVDNFIYQKRVMENGRNIFRIPTSIISVISIVILLLLLLFSVFTNKNLSFVLPVVLFIVILPLIYFFFRLILGIDFPFSSIMIVLFLGLLSGLILRNISNLIWFYEIKMIYKDGISNKHIKLIANTLKRNCWNFDLGQYIATFGLIDISIFNVKELNEHDVDFVDDKISQIRKTIKNNYGIIDSCNQNHIGFYFGNPNLTNQHWIDAANTCKMINEMPIVIND
ncbi:MAG TPA: hypothetical protein PK771_16175, partial [Spirochaetota bacterium]|nr:hypothetical protein [Spirochaetota bacterium]